MLKIEATRHEKWIILLFAVVSLILNTGMVVVNAPILFPTDVSGGVIAGAWWELIPGLLCTPLALYFLYWGWYRGKTHTRIIANDRTLAIVPAGRRAVFIKRTDCTGTRHYGALFLMKDGTTRRVNFPMTLVAREQKEFLPHLYQRWWPGREFQRDGSC